MIPLTVCNSKRLMPWQGGGGEGTLKSGQWWTWQWHIQAERCRLQTPLDIKHCSCSLRRT